MPLFLGHLLSPYVLPTPGTYTTKASMGQTVFASVLVSPMMVWAFTSSIIVVTEPLTGLTTQSKHRRHGLLGSVGTHGPQQPLLDYGHRAEAQVPWIPMVV